MEHSNIQYAIGTMSGTSMDGIDIALLKSDGHFHVELIDSATYSYQACERFYLKAAEFAIRQQARQHQGNRDELICATKKHFSSHFTLYMQQTQQSYPYQEWDEVVKLSTRLHAEVILNLIKRHMDVPIGVIGYHGQTLYHSPEKKITIQIGDAAYLSELTDLPVVYDFRQQDIERGGQGAPLAPVFHQALVLHEKLSLPCAVINCGGISNISLIKGPGIEELKGFDIGPGNVLLDHFVRIKTNYQEHYDQDGRYAKQGKIQIDWLERLKNEACRIKNYAQLPAPKSLDTNDFSLPEDFLNLSIEDGCATLAAYTADCIVQCILNMESAWRPKKVILVGGGWHHPSMTAYLKEWLPANIAIQKADEIGWKNNAIEAEIFAYLAIRKLQHLPFSFPLTTGVKQALCGGECYEKQ